MDLFSVKVLCETLITAYITVMTRCIVFVFGWLVVLGLTAL